MLKITSEDLVPHQVEHVEEGGTSLFCHVPPLGEAQVVASVASKTGSQQRGQKQQAVGGHLQLRQAAHCFRITNMPFCHTEQRFFVAVVAFYFPTIEIGLHQHLQRHV